MCYADRRGLITRNRAVRYWKSTSTKLQQNGARTPTTGRGTNTGNAVPVRGPFAPKTMLDIGDNVSGRRRSVDGAFREFRKREFRKRKRVCVCVCNGRELNVNRAVRRRNAGGA